MKKTMKRILAIMLVVVMTIGIAPLSEFVGLELPEFDGFKKLADSVSEFFGGFGTKAEATVYSGVCGENLTWTLDTDSDVLTISGTGDMDDFEHSEYGPPWGAFAYSNNENQIWVYIKKVVIENGVTSIGNNAFFAGFYIDSITIPDSVTRIGDYAFYNCENLKKLDIPDSVTEIGSRIIGVNKYITDFVIPDGVVKMGSISFVSFDKIKTLTIGAGIKSLDFLTGNSGWQLYLEKISVSTNNKFFSSDENGVLFNNDKTELLAYPGKISQTVYNVPQGVKRIGDYAFCDAKSLTEIYMPNGVIDLGYMAFSSCSNLSNVNIPDTVVNIDGQDTNNFDYDETGSIYVNNCLIHVKKDTQGVYEIAPGTVWIAGSAFSECELITDIVIPESVISIGDNAFSSCVMLEEIFIPNSVVSIGDNAFSSCVSLKKIDVDEENKYFTNDEIGALYSKDKKELIRLPQGNNNVIYKIPENIEIIKSGAFLGCESIETITIPDGVKAIGDSVFTGCTLLTSIVLPEGITSIGNDAFSRCVSLVSIVLPKAVTSVGNNAFYGCSSLESIVLPDGVTTLQYGVFRECTSLTSIVLPKGITSIGDSAFSGCSSLKSIIIPESITRIGSDAFENCTSIEAITVPERVKYIGDSAFSGCSAMTSVKINGGVLESGSFFKCVNLRQVFIGKNVTSISKFAFVSCLNLEKINVDSQNRYYSSDEYGILYNKSKSVLIKFPISLNIEAYVVPEFVQTIDKYAFESSQFLKVIIIPENVLCIGDEAFKNCYNLTDVEMLGESKRLGWRLFYHCKGLKEIPNGLSNFAPYIFEGCTGLESAEIPEGVKQIPESAFRDCVNITVVNLPHSLVRINDYAFYNTGITSVLLPEKVDSVSHGAFARCKNLTSITIHESLGYLGVGAFRECFSLSDVYYTGTEEKWNKITFNPDNDCLTSATIYYNVFTYSVVEDVESIDETEYKIFVVNEDGMPIQDAKVTWNDTEQKTDEKGIVTFKRETEEEPVIVVEKENYITVSTEGTDYAKNPDGYDYFTLYSAQDKESKFKLSTAKYVNGIYSYDVLNRVKRLSASCIDSLVDDAEFNLNCMAVEPESVIKYELCQNEIVIAVSEDGYFEKLKIEDFYTNIQPVVRTYTDESSYVENPINLYIMEDPSVEETSIKIGEKISLEFDDDVPILGGTTFDFDFPTLPIDCYISDGKVHVGINAKLFGASTKPEKGWSKEKKQKWLEELKEHEKEMNDLIDTLKKSDNKVYGSNLNQRIESIMRQKKQFNLPAVQKFDVKILGYGEGAWNDKKFSTLSIDLFFIASYSVEKTWQTSVWIIPVVINIGADVDGKLALRGYYDFQEGKLGGEAKLSIKPSFNVFGGVGIGKAVGIGTYGSASMDFEVQIFSSKAKSGLNHIDLTGELGIKAYLLFLEHKRIFAHQTWHLYSGENTIPKVSTMAASPQNDSMYDLNNYTVADISYLKNESQWMGGETLHTAATESSNISINSLITDTYRNSKPNVLTNGKDTVMVYTGADTTRDVYNLTRVMYSVYDETSDSWSEPIQLDNNKTADYSPYLYSDGNDIWVTYSDSTKTYDSESTIEDTISSQAIKAAKFNSETGRFDAVQTVKNSDGKYISLPEISVVDSVPVVVWQSNSDLDIFGMNSTNQICYSTFNGSSWSDETVLVSGLNSITGYSIGNVDGNSYVTYITDADNNFETPDDKQLWTVDFTGTTKLLDEGLLSNPVFSVNPENSLDSLFWYSDKGIMTSSDMENADVLIECTASNATDKFVVLDDRILYLSATENSSNLFETVYDKETSVWSKPIQISEQNSYIDSFGAIRHNDSVMSVMESKTVTISEENIDDKCDLLWAVIKEKNDISINYVSYDYKHIKPNSSLPLEMCVYNNGDTIVNEVNLSVQKEDSSVILNQKVPVNILPGNSETVEFYLDLGDEITLENYNVCASVDSEIDCNIDDNTYEITVGYSDFTVESEEIIVEDKHSLVVNVTNNSFAKSAGKLHIYNTLDETKPIETIDIDEIGHGEGQLFTVIINEKVLGGNIGVISVVAESDVEGISDRRNRSQTYIELPESDSGNDDEPEVGVLGTVIWNVDGVKTYVTIKEGDDLSFPDDPLKFGYDFDGWIPEVYEEEMVVEFIATWTPRKVDVLFDANGGLWQDGENKKNVVTEYNAEIIVPEVPIKDGYMFAGWAYNGQNVGSNLGVMDDIVNRVYYAEWVSEDDIKYTVETYVMNTSGEYEVSYSIRKGTQGETATVQPDIDTGFSLDTEKSVLSGIVTADNSLVLKVYIDRNIYILTTIIDGVSTETKYYYGSTISETTSPTKEGYKFMGWDREIPSTMPDENILVTAIFEKSYICPDCGEEILGEDAINDHIADKTKVTISGGMVISGEMKPYATITVKAEQVNGKIFSHWVVEGATVADANSPETTIVLGSGEITITAEYDGCECKCHQGGIIGFFFKIVLFFQKLFGNNLVCFCGAKH